MPHGHEPHGLFGTPHYDVYFYLVPEAERLAVDPADPLYLDKAAREPLRELMPADYTPPPALEPVPAMGVHWTDATHPIFQGEPFSHIFIYGAWDGEVTFLEPMITRDVFLTKRTVSAEVKQPAGVVEAGCIRPVIASCSIANAARTTWCSTT